MRYLPMVLVLLGALLLPPPLDAAPKGDKRVESALKRLKVSYEVDDEGDFLLDFAMDGNRTQRVVVFSRTQTYGAYEIREIASGAHYAALPIDGTVATQLMLDNPTRKVGHWEMQSGSDAWSVVFTARIPAKMKPDQLLDVIEAVGATADDMEQRLNGGDRF